MTKKKVTDTSKEEKLALSGDTPTTEEKSTVSIYDVFETDEDAEEDGKWFRGLIPNAPEMSFKIRRFTSQSAITERNRLVTVFKRHAKKDGTFPEEMADKILSYQIANAILLDWEAILDRDGKEIKYDKAAAFKLVSEMKNFREALIQHSSDMDNFRVEDRDETVKN